jgi:hypothetical protein
MIRRIKPEGMLSGKTGAQPAIQGWQAFSG